MNEVRFGGFFPPFPDEGMKAILEAETVLKRPIEIGLDEG